LGGGGGDGEAILVVIAVMQFSDDNDGIEPTVPASPSSNAATTPNRSACDHDEWQQKADTYIEDNELTANWADPDGDCLSTCYELNSSGTRPDDSDSNRNGIIDGLETASSNNG